VAALESKHALAAEALAAARSRIEEHEALAARMRKNAPLGLRVGAAPAFLEWALVYFKDEDGVVRLRPISFEESTGIPLAAGTVHDLGPGVAAVVSFLPQGASDPQVRSFVHAGPDASGEFGLE
jgi:hypothetical protein